MSENINLTYYQRNREIILNRAKDYYECLGIIMNKTVF